MLGVQVYDGACVHVSVLSHCDSGLEALYLSKPLVVSLLAVGKHNLLLGVRRRREREALTLPTTTNAQQSRTHTSIVSGPTTTKH